MKANRIQRINGMYLQYYALAFFLFYLIDKENWYTWLLLSILCSLLKCNTVFFGVNLDIRYFARTTEILIFAIFLMKKLTLMSGYQSVILLLFLLANEFMLAHLSLDNYFYVNFEAIIYGLVSCQFLAIVPRVWSYPHDSFANYLSGNKNKRLVDRV